MNPVKVDLTGLKSLIVPLLIVITVIVIIPFAFLPLLDNVSETNNDLDKEQKRLTILADKLDFLNSLDEQDVTDKISIVEKALPVGKSLAPLVVGMQNLAISHDLIVESINLSPGRVGTESAEVNKSGTPQSSSSQTAVDSKTKKNSLFLEINLKGKIADLIKFLKKLEGAKRLSLIDQLSVESSEEVKDREINIQLSVPFRPVRQVSGDIIAQPLPTLSDANLETLSLIEGFVDYTNIQINTVRTNIIKDPFKDD